jgi:hypothetical protein
MVHSKPNFAAIVAGGHTMLACAGLCNYTVLPSFKPEAPAP